MNHGGPGHHLLIDASITMAGRNTILRDCARIPGHAARTKEAQKFSKDRRTTSPVVSRGHRLVPFVLEDGGRFGEHALALLYELAKDGVHKERLKAPPHWPVVSSAQVIAHWTHKWWAQISGWFHYTLAVSLLETTQQALL